MRNLENEASRQSVNDMLSRLDRIPQRDGQTEFLTNIALCTISHADACDNIYRIDKPCLLQIAYLTAVKRVTNRP